MKSEGGRRDRRRPALGGLTPEPGQLISRARRAELDLVHLRLRLRVCISSLPVLRVHVLIDRN